MVRDCSSFLFMCAWCLETPNLSTGILGASRAAQVTENLQTIDVVAKLDDPE